MTKVLIVEDDPQIAKSLKINLKLGGFKTECASSVNEAHKALQDQHFDVICLDIGLPDGSGLELCEKIRASGDDTPILFISARTDEATVVKGINNGADDYLRKPFGLEELKARMKKIIRKFAPPTSVLTFGQLTIDPGKRVVTVMNTMINLGRKELDILMLLTRKAGDIVTRENILNTIYDGPDLYDRTVDSHISHLRRKLREVTGNALQINSVYGLGYRLEWK